MPRKPLRHSGSIRRVSEASAFRRIDPMGPLKVPVVAPPPVPTLFGKAPGTPVRRAEPLGDVPPSAPAALAPVSGIIGEQTTVILASGRQVPGVILEPAAEPDPSAAPTD